MNMADAFLGALVVTCSKIDPNLGAFAAAMAMQLPTSFDRSSQRQNDRINARMSEEVDRLDESKVGTDEFAELFKSMYTTLALTNQELKENTAIEILVNAMLGEEAPDKLPYGDLELFSKATESLSLGSLRVLSSAIRLGKPENKMIRPEELASSCGNLDIDLCIALLRELEGFHFVFVDIANSTYNGRRSVDFGITGLGLRYHKYILAKAEKPAGDTSEQK